MMGAEVTKVIKNNPDIFFKHILPQLHGEAMCFKDDLFYLVNPKSFAEVNRAQSVTRDVTLLAHKYGYPTYAELMDDIFLEITPKYKNLPGGKTYDVYWYFKHVPRASVFYVYFALLLSRAETHAELANLLSLYPPSVYREIYPGDDSVTMESLYAKFLALHGFEHSLSQLLRATKQCETYEHSKVPAVQAYQAEFTGALELAIAHLMERAMGDVSIETLCKIITTAYFLQLTVPLGIVAASKGVLRNVMLDKKLRDKTDPTTYVRTFKYSRMKGRGSGIFPDLSENFKVYKVQLQSLFNNACTFGVYHGTSSYSREPIAEFAGELVNSASLATKETIRRLFKDNPDAKVKAQAACKEMLAGMNEIPVLKDFLLLYANNFKIHFFEPGVCLCPEEVG